MKSVLAFLCLLAACGGVVAQTAPVETAQKAVAPVIQDLGNQRYRVGEIDVDKAAGVFTVAGQVLRDRPPLEFLVVTRGGHKAYEAALQVNADAFQFNLACILIGLDADNAPPENFSKPNEPAQGDPVEVLVSWFDGDRKITINGVELLGMGEPPEKIESRDWVYTGSLVLEDGRYLADLSGTLIGFVHRAESVIEHKQGIGLGEYGSVNFSRDAPPVGTKVELTIRRLDKAK